jgi:hypothetical protein
MSAGFQVRDASADRTITGFQARDASNADRTITQGRVIGPDGVDRVFWDPSGSTAFTATASPSHVAGSSSGTGTATTAGTTVTATGGTPPYSYAWACVDHTNSTAPVANDPASNATAFTQTNLGPGEFASADFTCTVTDSATPSNTAVATATAGFFDRTGL